MVVCCLGVFSVWSFREKESWRHPSECSLPKFGPFNLEGNSDRYCGIHCTYWTRPPGEVGFMWVDGQAWATMATENGLFVQIRPCINTTASAGCSSKIILLTNCFHISVCAKNQHKQEFAQFNKISPKVTHLLWPGLDSDCDIWYPWTPDFLKT